MRLNIFTKVKDGYSGSKVVLAHGDGDLGG